VNKQVDNIVEDGTNALLDEGYSPYSPSGGLASLHQASAEYAGKFREMDGTIIQSMTV
jgi:hypothetical protein